jgi:hypothetical protein
MAHFAQIENNIVTQVIVIDNNNTLDEQGNESETVGIQFCTDLLGGQWVQTSYNTHSDEHPQGNPFRKNYAGIGYTYDSTRDAFIALQPYPSWTINEDTCQWESPIAYPTISVDEYGNPTTYYKWDEPTTSWILVPEQGE